MLSKRQIGILELMELGDEYTGEQIAGMLGVTARTVRADMRVLTSTLSTFGAVIDSKRGKGYRLTVHDPEAYNRMKMQTQEMEDQSDRVVKLALLLLQRKTFLKLEEAAETLYVSESTVKNDLRVLKKDLESRGLAVITKPKYGIRIIGSERQLRNVYRSFLEADAIIPGLKDKRYQELRELVVSVLKEEDTLVTDIGVDNLVIHIWIASERMDAGLVADISQSDQESITRSKEYHVAQKLAKSVGIVLGVDLPKDEIIYMTMHILGAKSVSYEEKGVKDFTKVVEPRVMEISRELLRIVDNHMQLALSTDNELLCGIALHLKPALNRFKYGLTIRNPMLSEIKQAYPEAFDASVLMGKKLQELTDVAINQDELGYLALHVGAAMARQESQRVKKRALVVCATGIASSQLLYYKLRARFSGRMEVAGTCSAADLQRRSLEDIDLIISTVPLTSTLSTPIVNVHTLLRESDVGQIERILTDRKQTLSAYIRSDHIFLQQTYTNRDDVLQFLVEQMEKRFVVPSNLLALIKEREEMAPTFQENLVAVPHPIYPVMDEPVVLCCTLQQPIDWGGNEVQVIFLFCIPKQYNEGLQQLYESMVVFIEDRQKVKQLIHAQDLAACLPLLS
ncbi:BglG family transcription antiterminator [Terribacillus sp. AE2B 122]|uniref:BglG family transcription antiterminator n=1 Tax=Terribacillus sp. AE2B 122 TaxID=1331902 RepID=UPI001581A6A4|nr:BglG family transcription antiterminator [Terribacillus sp. AE2B 122]